MKRLAASVFYNFVYGISHLKRNTDLMSEIYITFYFQELFRNGRSLNFQLVYFRQFAIFLENPRLKKNWRKRNQITFRIFLYAAISFISSLRLVKHSSYIAGRCMMKCVGKPYLFWSQ